MGYWAAASFAVSAIGALAQARNSSKQNSYQSAVNQYNAQQQYNLAQQNIAASALLAKYNIGAVQAVAGIQNKYTAAMVDHNAKILQLTSAYNDELFEAELEDVWETEELDLQLLHLQRAKERGSIEAMQAVSGTVMGQDSNADVIVSQQTMEEMDAFIVSHNADRRAAEIMNARARSAWEAEMQIQKVMYEGSLDIAANSANARLQSKAMAVEGMVSTYANMNSAKSQFIAGLFGAQNQYNANQIGIKNNFTGSLANSTSNLLMSYYRNKTLETQSNSTLLD